MTKEGVENDCFDLRCAFVGCNRVAVSDNQFSKGVPADLVDIVGRAELTKSLATSSYQQAKKLRSNSSRPVADNPHDYNPCPERRRAAKASKA